MRTFLFRHTPLQLALVALFAVAALGVGLAVLSGALPAPSAGSGGLLAFGVGSLLSATERNTLGDLLIFEEEHFTRIDATYHGSDFVFGQVVAEVGGKLVAFAPTASDGSETPVGVAPKAYAAAAADVPGFVIEALAVLNADLLVWPAGITAPQKAAALASLKTRHILARSVL